MRISDWSSDVCSSDLDVHRNAELRWPHVQISTKHAAVQGDRCVPETIAALKALDADPDVAVIVIARGGGDRTEERRVGKECVSTCRSRWAPYPYKTNHIVTK